MEIQGRFGKYECDWVQVGHTYAEVVVKIKKSKSKFFGIFEFVSREVVWKSSGSRHRRTWEVEEAYPATLRKWYVEVVDEYENYTEAWSGELEIPAQEKAEENYYDGSFVSNPANLAAISIIMGK